MRSKVSRGSIFALKQRRGQGRQAFPAQRRPQPGILLRIRLITL